MEYEKFGKSLAEVEKSLSTSRYADAIADLHKSMALGASPIYAKAIIEASRVASSMQDTLTFSLSRIGLPSLAESSELAKTAMLAVAPLEELKVTKFFDLFPSEPQIKIFEEVIGTFESRFRLPDFAEMARLTETAQSSLTEAFSKYAVAVPDFATAVGSMKTPWLGVLDESRSIKGFAELQGIGEIVRTLPPFDENLAGMLRVNLGDFREQITWRPEVLADLQVRSDFYAGLGFNRALTDFPPLAFTQSLEIAGLQPVLIPAPADDWEIEEEIALSRTNKAHDKLQRFERGMRRLIDKVMTQAFGANWPRHRLPNGMYDEWQERKQTAENEGAGQCPLIDYADFTDYAKLICKRDNWREVFEPLFKRVESVRESFQRLHPIRLDTMHGRLISQEDELFLRVEIIRLGKAIRN